MWWMLFKSSLADFLSILSYYTIQYCTLYIYIILCYTILCFTLLYYTLLYCLYPFFSMCSLWPLIHFNDWVLVFWWQVNAKFLGQPLRYGFVCMAEEVPDEELREEEDEKEKEKEKEVKVALGFAYIFQQFSPSAQSCARYLRLQCPGHHLQRCPRNQHHRQLHLRRHRCRIFNLNRWLKRRQLRKSKLGRMDNSSLTYQEFAMMLSPVQPWAINHTDVYLWHSIICRCIVD